MSVGSTTRSSPKLPFRSRPVPAVRLPALDDREGSTAADQAAAAKQDRARRLPHGGRCAAGAAIGMQRRSKSVATSACLTIRPLHQSQRDATVAAARLRGRHGATRRAKPYYSRLFAAPGAAARLRSGPCYWGHRAPRTGWLSPCAHGAVHAQSDGKRADMLGWGIIGAGLMPADRRMRDSLKPQDNLYTWWNAAPRKRPWLSSAHSPMWCSRASSARTCWILSIGRRYGSSA